MKRRQHLIILVTLVLTFSLGKLNLYADTPTYSCEIRNGSFINSQVFEFDIYLTQIGTVQLELAGFNTGILLNAGFVNGGTITPTLLPGVSELNTSQAPTHIAYDPAFSCVKIAPQKPPRDYVSGITSGSIISNTSGTKVCRVRLSNTNEFGNDPLNFTWNMNVMPYHTVVAAFVPGVTHPVNAAITNASSQSKSENLSLFLEGLYTSGVGNHKAQDESGDHYAGPVADVITVQLAQATEPYSILYSTSNVLLYTNGKCFFSLPGAINGSYYVIVKHRNSIETWSASPVNFSGGMVSYDFTTGASQAYGNNLKSLNGGLFAVFGGDVSQDGIVDGSDMASVDNSATTITLGYVSEDANGDGVVDGSDMAVIDNNATSVVISIKP